MLRMSSSFMSQPLLSPFAVWCSILCAPNINLR